MKVFIYKDERWPDYGISYNHGAPIEITDELLQRYKDAEAHYHSMQMELKKLHEEVTDEITN